MMTESGINNLKEERLILAYDFGGFGLWLLGPLAWACGEAVLLTLGPSSAVSKGKTPRWKGEVEQSFSFHGSQKAEQGKECTRDTTYSAQCHATWLTQMDLEVSFSSLQCFFQANQVDNKD